MKRPLSPTPHLEFEHWCKHDLLRLADDLLGHDPLVIERCVAFVCAETRGIGHGRARAMTCRRLKHAVLNRSASEKLQSSILGRLERGDFSEQFKDQLRLAIHLSPKSTLAACQRGVASARPHVKRYCLWALALPSLAIAHRPRRHAA